MGADMNANLTAMMLYINANMDHKLLQFQSSVPTKADITTAVDAAVAPVTSRLDALENALAQIQLTDNDMMNGSAPPESSRTALSSASHPAATPAATPMSDAVKSGKPPAELSNPLRLILKGVERNLTVTIWKEIFAKMKIDVSMPDGTYDLIKIKPKNEKMSLFMDFPDVATLRNFKDAFEASAFQWVDDHNGKTRVLHVMRDKPLAERQKAAKLNHLYLPARALLRAAPKYVEGEHNINISGNTESVTVRTKRDLWYLFVRKNGVIVPNYDDCALLGITQSMADKFIEDNVSLP
jgi:hypothetical protein